MSFFFDNDSFFRDPFDSVFDNYVRSRLLNESPWLLLSDRPDTNQTPRNRDGQQQSLTVSSNDKSNDKSTGDSTQLTSQRPQQSRTGALDTLLRGPRIDVTETPTSYVIHADLPGLSKENVHLTVADDMLTLSGERKDEHEEKTDRRHVVERSFGRFERRVRIPPDAVVDGANASMEDGVLKVVLGKKKPESPEGKRITVN